MSTLAGRTETGPATARTARAAACGKVILLGEHAVVYGVPAIAAGIDRGAEAEATLLDGSKEGGGQESRLVLGGRTLVANPASPEDLDRAFAALLGDDSPRVAVKAASELVPGGGLGSSAALGVAIARAVEALIAIDREPGAGTQLDEGERAAREERVLARALAWERVFHGNPSGVDTYAAAHGGTFRFVRGEPVKPIRPATDLCLCVGLSGPGASTRTMVEGLARLLQRKPEQRRSIDAIAALVSNAGLAIEAGDLGALGQLMDMNQMVLAGLFLSTEAIERLCRLAREAGALGAKLTGSGGGGAVLALVPPALPGAENAAAVAVLAAWKQAGFEGFTTRIAAP